MAATGSCSAAARELGCTQPAVSQQMKVLESSAGTLLLAFGADAATQAGRALVVTRPASSPPRRSPRSRAARGGSVSSQLPERRLDPRCPDGPRRPCCAPSTPAPGPRWSSPNAALGQCCEATGAFHFCGRPRGEWTTWWSRPLHLAATGSWSGHPGHPLAAAGSVTVGVADDPWIAGCALPPPAGQRGRCREAPGSAPPSFATDDYRRCVGLVGASGLGWRSLPGRCGHRSVPAAC
ncbi:LysR family transcriptional regulator [Streptomyces sp. KL116D]|uniref:LysR family transcriptional regulator n=1 Tax=Streptomyces sp. KL116D TaxID=3045152 RepID=UPI003558B461